MGRLRTGVERFMGMVEDTMTKIRKNYHDGRTMPAEYSPQMFAGTPSPEGPRS